MKIKLNKGCTILIDFDGTICENKYPKMGKVLPGTKDFLDKCKKNKIKVLIWSARCNFSKVKNSGSYSLEKIKKYMEKNKLFYSGFLLAYKPIGSSAFDMPEALIDDRATNRLSDLEFQ